MLTRWIVMLASAASICLLVSGCPVPPVEPPPSLVGDYTGTYTYESRSTDITKPILWKFTADHFSMEVDSSKLDSGEERVFCDWSGIYSLSDGIRLGESNSDQLCEASKYKPYGDYSLDESYLGAINMTSQTSDSGATAIRRLHLERVR